jgi:hypothetical protein
MTSGYGVQLGRVVNRVVVGAFVHNGHHYSAPAFVTSFTLNNESRTHDPESGRLSRVEYGTQYVHPSLSTCKMWDSDSFVYDLSGRLLGWTGRRGESAHEFTADGLLVFEGSLARGVTLMQAVRYILDPATGRLDWETDGDPNEPGDRFSATLIARPAGPSSCVRAGGTAAVDVLVASECAVTRITFGMAFDPTQMTIVNVEPSAEVRAMRGGLGPQFWRVEMQPETESCESVEAAVVVAMAESLDVASATGLAAGEQTSVVRLVFETSPDAELQTSLDVRFVSCLTVDDVPLYGRVYCGNIPMPLTSRGTSLGVADQCFTRGDYNGDGARDISDVITTLLFLFGGERAPTPPTCLDACDLDDSGKIDVTDALAHRRRFFEGEPGRPDIAGGLQDGTCSPDFGEDGLSCESSGACAG